MRTKKRSKVNLKNIPAALRKHDNWVGWNYEKNKEGKYKIVKRHMVNHHKISVHDPDDWVDFETCMEHAHQFDGIGFVITKNDPLVVWTINKCCDKKTGNIKKNARIILRHLDSYTEYSRNGKGLIVIVKGIIGPVGRKNKNLKLQVFDEDKFFVLTGKRVNGYPKGVMARKNVCARLHKKYFKNQIKKALKNPLNQLKWKYYKDPGYSGFNEAHRIIWVPKYA